VHLLIFQDGTEVPEDDDGNIEPPRLVESGETDDLMYHLNPFYPILILHDSS
jgi:hypothetical protein